jgi:outer membrane protein assembly factor BamB
MGERMTGRDSLQSSPKFIHRFLLLVALLSLSAGCSPKPDVLWKYETGGPVYASPAISGNKIVIGSNDQHLYALDHKNGSLMWKVDLGGQIMMAPYAENDKIYIGSSSGMLYQLRSQDGSIVWKFNTKSPLAFDMCADSEGLYIGDDKGGFHKINRQGKILWTFQTGFKMTSSCTFYKDLVLTTSWDMNVYALRRDTGKFVWKHPTGEYNYGNGVVAGDSFYYTTHEALYCFEAASGKLLFQKKIEYNTHLLFHNNALYTQENGSTKRSLNGDFIQNVPFKAFSEFSPSLAGDSILLADTGNHLIGISPDLKIRWKFRAKNLFWSTGVFQNGVYYVGNRDSHVYALKLP